MKKAIAVLALFVFVCVACMGCATLKSAVDSVADGVCWVDRQIPACEWAGEEDAPKNDANDPLPGN